MQTYTRVCKVLGALIGVDPACIGPGQPIGEDRKPNFYAADAQPLGLDSLDIWQMVCALEEQLGITMPDEELHSSAVDHVGGLVAYVQGKLDAKVHELAADMLVINAIGTASALATPFELWMAPFATTSSNSFGLSSAASVLNSGVLDTGAAA